MSTALGTVEAPRFDFGEPTNAKLERLLRIQAAHTRACALLRRRIQDGTTGDVFLMHARRCSILGWLLIASRRDCGLTSQRIRPVHRVRMGHFHATTAAARQFAYTAHKRLNGGAS